MEVDNALSQVKKTDKVFRIIGNIMVASSKTTVKKELSELTTSYIALLLTKSIHRGYMFWTIYSKERTVKVFIFILVVLCKNAHVILIL